MYRFLKSIWEVSLSSMCWWKQMADSSQNQPATTLLCHFVDLFTASKSNKIWSFNKFRNPVKESRGEIALIVFFVLYRKWLNAYLTSSLHRILLPFSLCLSFYAFLHNPTCHLSADRGNKARWFHVGGFPEVSRQLESPAWNRKHLWGDVCDTEITLS